VGEGAAAVGSPARFAREIEMTDPYTPPETPAASGGALATNPWARPVGVLFSPVATFRSIREAPSWLPPLLILLVLVAASQVLLAGRMDMEAAIREGMERQGQTVTDEQVEQMAAMQSRFMIPCGVVLPLAGWTLIALLVWGLANVAGGEIGFRRSLGLSLHALMPNAVSALLTIPVLLGRPEVDPSEAQLGLLASHLAAFAPEDAPMWMLALLARVDLFSIWTLLLFGVGLHVVARLSKGAAAGVTLVLWLLWIAFTVGTAAMGWAG
jgi:hypothetical protein